jgi:hypothetical protein
MSCRLESARSSVNLLRVTRNNKPTHGRADAHCKHHAVEQEGQQREHYKNNAGPDAFVVLQNTRPRRALAARLLKIRRTDTRFGLQTVALLHTGHVHARQRGEASHVHRDDGHHRPDKRLVRGHQRGVQAVRRLAAAARVLLHDMRPHLHQRHFA